MGDAPVVGRAMKLLEFLVGGFVVACIFIGAVTMIVYAVGLVNHWRGIVCG